MDIQFERVYWPYLKLFYTKLAESFDQSKKKRKSFANKGPFGSHIYIDKMCFNEEIRSAKSPIQIVFEFICFFAEILNLSATVDWAAAQFIHFFS